MSDNAKCFCSYMSGFEMDCPVHGVCQYCSYLTGHLTECSGKCLTVPETEIRAAEQAWNAERSVDG